MRKQASTGRNDKGTQLTYEDLGEIEDRLEAIKWDQKKVLSDLRKLKAREAEQAEQARRAKARRSRVLWLSVALAGILAGFGGLIASRGLATAIYGLLDSTNEEVLRWLCYGFRALSAGVYLVPASVCIAKARVSREMRIALIGVIAGGCLFAFNLLDKQVVSDLADASGLASAITTPILLLLLVRGDFDRGKPAANHRVHTASKQNDSPI